MNSKVDKFTLEINEHLQKKGIYLKNNGDSNVNYIGIILDILKGSKPLEHTVCIAKSPAELPSCDYNLVMLEKNEHEEFTSSEYLKHNLAFEKFYEQQLGRKMDFLIGENDGKNYVFIRIKEAYFYNNIIIALTSILPKLFAGMFTKEEVQAAMPFLLEIAKHCGDGDAENIILSKSDIDFEKFELEFNQRELRRCAQYMAEQRAQNAKSSYDRHRETCERLLREYNQAIEAMNECIALINSPSADDGYITNFVNYLTANKRVKIRKIDRGDITYDVVGCLDFFDMDMYKAHAAETRGAMYENISNDDRPIVKKILDDIFVNRKYKVNTAATFRLHMDHTSTMYSGEEDNSDLRRRYPGKCPSPHVQLINCHGGFASLWNEALMSGNIIMAIENTITYASNLNWSDSVVTKKFIKEVKTNKCIEDTDGNLYNLIDLINIYKEKNDGEAA